MVSTHVMKRVGTNSAIMQQLHREFRKVGVAIVPTAVWIHYRYLGIPDIYSNWWYWGKRTRNYKVSYNDDLP